MNRRTLEELKQMAINYSKMQCNGKTPSRKALSNVIKESEYVYHGLSTNEFQEYCGFSPNKSGLENKVEDSDLLKELADVCIAQQEIPNQKRLRKWIRDGIYSRHTLEVRFRSLIGLQEALYIFCQDDSEYTTIFNLPGWKINFDEMQNEDATSLNISYGYVYLVRHGARNEYKIGKTYNPIRREGELKTELPEKLEPVHRVKTDDPSGVESYWHRRFAGKRKNGEWFELSGMDVKAFKRWTKIC